jgi:hypothetical protein
VFSTLPAASLISLVDHPGDSSHRGALEPTLQQLLHIEPNSNFIDSITKNKMKGSIRAIVASHNTLSARENTTFSFTKNLSQIIIKHNEIIELEARTFESVLNLNHLDFGYNSIEYADGSLFRRNELLTQKYFRTIYNYINWI